MEIPADLNRAEPAIDADAHFDAIFAAVRNCSPMDVWERIQAIALLLENADDLDVLTAVGRLDRLIERLRFLDAYGGTRAHLLSAWRYLMRGDYPRVHARLESAADSCDSAA
jgi:hypothetical protein